MSKILDKTSPLSGCPTVYILWTSVRQVPLLFSLFPVAFFVGTTDTHYCIIQIRSDGAAATTPKTGSTSTALGLGHRRRAAGLALLPRRHAYHVRPRANRRRRPIARRPPSANRPMGARPPVRTDGLRPRTTSASSSIPSVLFARPDRRYGGF